MVVLFFIVDIILGFKTGFYREGLPVRNPIKVAHNYLRSHFLVDLISILPLLINLIAKETIYLRIFNSLLILKLS